MNGNIFANINTWVIQYVAFYSMSSATYIPSHLSDDAYTSVKKKLEFVCNKVPRNTRYIMVISIRNRTLKCRVFSCFNHL